MGKPLSMDLRSRALAAVDAGVSCRPAATLFGVAVATVIRWHDQRRSTGSYAVRPQDGDTRSRRIEAHRETVLALHGAQRDVTLNDLHCELAQGSVTVAISTLHRFFARHGIASKKIGHAVEQVRAYVLGAREGCFDGQLDLDPVRLVSSTGSGQA
jgi:transposase